MLVAVVPGKTNCIFPYSADVRGLYGRLEHRQRSRLGLRRLTGIAAFFGSRLITERTRAGVAQPSEGVMAFVAIFPFDLHARAATKVNVDDSRSDLRARFRLQGRVLAVFSWRHALV